MKRPGSEFLDQDTRLRPRFSMGRLYAVSFDRRAGERDYDSEMDMSKVRCRSI